MAPELQSPGSGEQPEDPPHSASARLDALINQTVSGIAEVDLTGCFTFVNDRYCELTGYAREELVGKMRVQEITHAEDLPRNLEDFRRLIEEGVPFAIEKRYARKDGSIVWLSKASPPSETPTAGGGQSSRWW
ncbi:MAG: PAS domain S-box protein [Pyrinomonadaceae bacterium]